jgi:hypothetical protein
MQCEKCGLETETVVCGACGSNIAKVGPYCYSCGASLERGQRAEASGGDESIDFSDRVLCSDGTCIGVINEQGVCKVCGKPYTPEQ